MKDYDRVFLSIQDEFCGALRTLDLVDKAPISNCFICGKQLDHEQALRAGYYPEMGVDSSGAVYICTNRIGCNQRLQERREKLVAAVTPFPETKEGQNGRQEKRAY